MKNHVSIIASFLVTILFFGCPSQEVKKEKPAPKPVTTKKPNEPEMTIQLASLDLSLYGKKIEHADISKFTEEMRREKIDILTLQGITRYPGLATRIDVVDELSKSAEMRSAFGETISLNNRQNGNAIFSTYPIRSNENTHYANLQSNGFETALQAVIDCGVRDVVVVGTKLPTKVSIEELESASGTLNGFNAFYINHPIIIAGSIPRDASPQFSQTYNETQRTRDADAPHVWYSSDGSLKFISSRAVKTVFGSMVIVQFGIFRQKQP